MVWLNYSDDEVKKFHPAFQNVADKALEKANLENRMEWVHHLRSPGSTLIPDFVLQDKKSKRWHLAVEIKRTPNALFSERNQIQAKGYAESNISLYPHGTPQYFAISNLEKTILFALNGSHPVRECRVLDGFFDSGSFLNDDVGQHKNRLIDDILNVISIVESGKSVAFEVVWQGVLGTFFSFVDSIIYDSEISIREPNTPNWNYVRNYFGTGIETDSKRIFLLRCLMAEYLRGYLTRHNHISIQHVPPLLPNKNSIANSIGAFRSINFEILFDNSSGGLYRGLNSGDIEQILFEYIKEITQKINVADIALNRQDSIELMESFLSSLYPVEDQNIKGKVQTDPELADILATLAIKDIVSNTLEPCCGDGPILIAAYERLRMLGASRDDAISSTNGIEVDPFAMRIAAIRLSLREPNSIAPSPSVKIKQGDMFCHRDTVKQADVILMNPPFKRYESQGNNDIPVVIKNHYKDCIAFGGLESITTSGQANLFNYYVEFVGANMKKNAILGVILDNKWFHSKYGKSLRQFILDNFEILCLLEYPHDSFFTGLTIATSIIIIKKINEVPDSHEIKFIRSKTDPRMVDLKKLSNAFHDGASWPIDWSCRKVKQNEINARTGWKTLFANELKNNYRLESWPTLDTLFKSSRRGSLQKEGGGIKVYEFPFNLTNYGPKRNRKINRRPFQTNTGRALSVSENQDLKSIASKIPSNFRGYALQKANAINHYTLNTDDVSLHQTIESPLMRSLGKINQNHDGRLAWDDKMDDILSDLMSQPEIMAYIEKIESIVGLDLSVLDKHELWISLREPVAGELIIPRKTRDGHRVHINPFVYSPQGRQVKLSSNFLTYYSCQAVDINTQLDNKTAVKLIVAYLVSSFGQLQFEVEGYNREGLLCVEKHHFENIRIFDPRWVRSDKREAIIEAFENLPFPLSSNLLSCDQNERNTLDALFADEIVFKYPGRFKKQELVDEIHHELDAWILSRRP